MYIIDPSVVFVVSEFSYFPFYYAFVLYSTLFLTLSLIHGTHLAL